MGQSCSNLPWIDGLRGERSPNSGEPAGWAPRLAKRREETNRRGATGLLLPARFPSRRVTAPFKLGALATTSFGLARRRSRLLPKGGRHYSKQPEAATCGTLSPLSDCTKSSSRRSLRDLTAISPNQQRRRAPVRRLHPGSSARSLAVCEQALQGAASTSPFTGDATASPYRTRYFATQDG
jgi:hypothetical protein